MGQKVNPTVFRLGLSQQWRSRWFSDKGYAQMLRQDVNVRKFLMGKLKDAGIDRIDIERFRGEFVVTIIAAKPGIIIGRGGTGIEDLKKEIQKKFLKGATSLKVNIQEVDNPNLSAGAVLQICISDLEKRIPFRRIMKQNIDKVLKAGAQGVKIRVSGRLNGAEIARRETLTQGKIPLHTLRGNIQYARGAARTTYGAIGVKVWIYRGLYFAEQPSENAVQKPAPRMMRRASITKQK
ncbi:MAG: 30S ribosomal protein S3 [Candidatus Komeilibacteria bacterium]|nr:30S ribosomal protein S3 [Candidatus Komeilibacteria bacterium]